MAQNVDFHSLYSILVGYAQKKHSPTIEVNEFLDFLEQYAKHHADEQPEWMSWSIGTSAKFWEELKLLTDAGTCGLQEKGKLRYLYLPKYCATLVDNAYQASFEPQGVEQRIPPFPSEFSLNISLPEESFTFIKVNELATQLEQTIPKDALVNLSFSPSLGSILLLGSKIYNEFLEAALVRVRGYLVKGSNQEFFQQKLSLRFHGREDYPRDVLNELIQRPREIADDIREGKESSYLLWIFFCGEIRNDLEDKKMLSSDGSTVLQAAYIIEQFNAFYNKIAKTKKDKERAFEELLTLLAKPPYLFKRGQIAKLVGHDSLPLLGRYYNQQELSIYLDEISTAAKDEVPRLIAISDTESTAKWYILKQKLPLLCVRYLLDAQPTLKSAVLDRWEDALMKYEFEESMTSAGEFETMLWHYLHALIPPLATMLEYKRMILLYQEMNDSWEGYTEFVKLFNKDTGKLYPLSVLLFLNQKKLLSEARDRLPLPYTFPFIVKIIAFFRKQKKQAKKSQQSDAPQPGASTKEEPLTLKSVCAKLEAALVPEGYTSEWYLIRLYEKWSKPLKKNEQKDIMKEVNRLIRNRIRRNAPLYKPSQIDEDFLIETASGLIEDSPSLRRLEQDSLKQYIKLYTLNLLRTMRV